MASRLAYAAISIATISVLPGCGPSSSSATQSIQNKGSDTMIELAQAWAEAYTASSVEVSGGGSSVGITSLVNGTVDIANASREMHKDEIATATQRTGKDPVKHVVGYDALAIYVHPSNPLAEIKMEDLARIYGDKGDVTKWSQLGVKIPGCENDVIVRLSRQNSSGTWEYFKEAVLGKDAGYKLGTIDASGSKDLVKQVAGSPCAIGYSGMGYKTPDVKVLKVKKGDGPAVLPSVEAVHDKSYPISRPLFMYTLGQPAGAVADYLTWIRGPGQDIVTRVGYVPLSAVELAPSSAQEKR